MGDIVRPPILRTYYRKSTKGNKGIIEGAKRVVHGPAFCNNHEREVGSHREEEGVEKGVEKFSLRLLSIVGRFQLSR